MSINYLLNNNLRILSPKGNEIKTTHYRKNRKTGSIGLHINTIKRFSYLLKLVKEYVIEKTFMQMRLRKLLLPCRIRAIMILPYFTSLC